MRYYCFKCRKAAPKRTWRSARLEHSDGSFAGHEWQTACCGTLIVTGEEMAVLESEEAEAFQAQAEQDALAGESAYTAGRQAEAFVEWQAEQEANR